MNQKVNYQHKTSESIRLSVPDWKVCSCNVLDHVFTEGKTRQLLWSLLETLYEDVHVCKSLETNLVGHPTRVGMEIRPRAESGANWRQ